MALTKNEVKYYSALLQKKYRSSEKKFLIEGKKIIGEMFLGKIRPEIVFITDEFIEANAGVYDTLCDLKVRVEKVKSKEIAKFCDTKTPQGIAAVIKQFSSSFDYNSEKVIALEDISDPGNLGTIIRTADWFGIKDIILSSNCADIYSPKVIRATMGSIFHARFYHPNNFVRTLNNYKDKGYKLVCADIKGTDIDKIKFFDKTLLILSNESKGPAEEILELVDDIVTIPKIGEAESLNVAGASSILIYKLTRKV